MFLNLFIVLRPEKSTFFSIFLKQKTVPFTPSVVAGLSSSVTATSSSHFPVHSYCDSLSMRFSMIFMWSFPLYHCIASEWWMYRNVCVLLLVLFAWEYRTTRINYFFSFCFVIQGFLAFPCDVASLWRIHVASAHKRLVVAVKLFQKKQIYNLT